MGSIKGIIKLNEIELQNKTPQSASWHADYAHSAWVYYSGLVLSEDKLASIFSQFGQIDILQVVRDKLTNSAKGFGYVKYEDQRSTILAVDNLCGYEFDGRLVKVDHVKDYKGPNQKMYNVSMLTPKSTHTEETVGDEDVQYEKSSQGLLALNDPMAKFYSSK